MLLSAVSTLVVAQPSSEFPEGLMNYSVQSTKLSELSTRTVCLVAVYTLWNVLCNTLQFNLSDHISLILHD